MNDALRSLSRSLIRDESEYEYKMEQLRILLSHIQSSFRPECIIAEFAEREIWAEACENIRLESFHLTGSMKHKTNITANADLDVVLVFPCPLIPVLKVYHDGDKEKLPHIIQMCVRSIHALVQDLTRSLMPLVNQIDFVFTGTAAHPFQWQNKSEPTLYTFSYDIRLANLLSNGKLQSHFEMDSEEWSAILNQPSFMSQLFDSWKEDHKSTKFFPECAGISVRINGVDMDLTIGLSGLNRALLDNFQYSFTKEFPMLMPSLTVSLPSRNEDYYLECDVICLLKLWKISCYAEMLNLSRWEFLSSYELRLFVAAVILRKKNVNGDPTIYHIFVDVLNYFANFGSYSISKRGDRVLVVNAHDMEAPIFIANQDLRDYSEWKPVRNTDPAYEDSENSHRHPSVYFVPEYWKEECIHPFSLRFIQKRNIDILSGLKNMAQRTLLRIQYYPQEFIKYMNEVKEDIINSNQDPNDLRSFVNIPEDHVLLNFEDHLGPPSCLSDPHPAVRYMENMRARLIYDEQLQKRFPDVRGLEMAIEYNRNEFGPPLFCLQCGMTNHKISSEKIMMCKNCYGATYCSRRCQKVHYKSHKRVCAAMAFIFDISKNESPMQRKIHDMIFSYLY